MFRFWRLLPTFITFICCFIIWSEKQPVSLRLTVWDGSEGLKILRETIAHFENAHPHIKVKIEAPSYPLYIHKLLVQYAAGSAADVAIFRDNFFKRFAKRGALLPLDNFIKSTPGFDVGKYYTKALEQLSHDGRLYALPRDISPIAYLFYNKRLFDEAGIPYPDGSWTWDFQVRPWLREKDFLWVLQNLSKKDDNGHPIQWGLSSYSIQYIANNLAISSGAKHLEFPEGSTRVQFDDPRTIRAYQFAADMIKNEQWIPNDATIRSKMQMTPRDHWISQKSAMFLSGMWEVANIRKRLRQEDPGWFEWDIALFPAYKDGTRKYLSCSVGYGILSTTKHPQEAWELVRWLSGEEGIQDFANGGLIQPAIPQMATTYPWIPDSRSPLEQRYPQSRFIAHQAVPYGYFEPSYEHWSQIADPITSHLSLVWTGYESAEKILKKGNQEAQHLLDNLLAKRKHPTFNWPIAIGLGALCILAIICWVYWPERRKRYSVATRAESRKAYLFLAPWLIGLFVFTLGPIIFSLIMSLTDWDLILPAKWNGFQNYIEAVTQDHRFWNSLQVTFTYVLLSVPFGVLFALMLAMLLNVKIKGIALYRTCFYLPSIASIVVTCLVWRKVFQTEGGLLNTIIYGIDGCGGFLGLAKSFNILSQGNHSMDWLGNKQTTLISLVIMSVWNLGSAMVILLGGLRQIPEVYYESSILDGAGGWRRFAKITLPLLSPSIFFCVITGIIVSFQVFTKAYVMTSGGPGDATRFYMLYLYDQAFEYLRMGYASSLAWILFLIILIFVLLKIKTSRWVFYEGEIQ